MFIALSLFLPYFFGLGALMHRVLRGSLRRRQVELTDLPRTLAATLLAGILANHMILLMVGAIGPALALGGVLALVGLVDAIASGWPELRGAALHGRMMFFGTLYLVVLYLPNIVLAPVTFWDARSIWFFHAKIIYFNSGLNEAAGWSDRTLAFSHVPYPKLVPILAAEFAYLAHFWNEYFPKAALVALLVPALLGAFSFIRTAGVSGVYLLSALFLQVGWWLWNGAVDAWIAIYASLAALFLGRWFESREDGDLYAAVLALGLTTNLKNEGLLVVLSISGAAVVISSARRGSTTLVFETIGRLRPWLWLVFSLFCIALWYWLKLKCGIHTDPYVRLDRLTARVADGSVRQVLDTLLWQDGVGKALGLVLVALVAARVFGLRTSPTVWMPLLTGTFYFVGMTLVYVGTAYPLDWHLATSSSRTMTTVVLLLCSSAYPILQQVERPVA